MIREMIPEDRNEINEMQFELQKFFSELDQTRESLSYRSIDDAYYYMQKMIDDTKSMNGKVFVAEKNNVVVGFIQGVIIEHKKRRRQNL